MPSKIRPVRDTLKSLLFFKYWRWFIAPVCLAVLFALLAKGGELIFSFLESWQNVEYLGASITAVRDGLFILSTFTLKFFVLTLLSPLNTFLSEKVDTDFNGFPFKFSFGQFFWAIIRSAAVALVALVFQFALMALLLLPAWFMGDTAFIIAMILVTSFFLGFAFLDYSLERYRVGLIDSFKWALRHTARCFHVGLLFNLFTYLPLQFGWYEAYYAGMGLLPPALTIYATLLYLSHRQSTVPVVS